MQIVLGLDVVVGLHVDPVPLRQPEGPGEPQPRVRRDPAPTVNDLANPGLRQTCCLGEPVPLSASPRTQMSLVACLYAAQAVRERELPLRHSA